MLFATPDFGASFNQMLFVAFCWAILLVFVVAGIVFGKRLRRSGSPRSRTFGFILVVTSCLIPLFCFLAPPYLVRLVYGNYPIANFPYGRIRKGMSVDEVEAVLGSPHERYTLDKEETYIYWQDSFDIHYNAVGFGPDKRVIRIYGG